MGVYLYAEGGVVPASCDYDLESDGVLVDFKRKTARTKGIIRIVLKKGEKQPSKE